ncbi:aldo/keto reductase [Salinimicrobium sp. MT39]|uniref:Aldo/keto reductase n=1 Tax=Salinimicrobium profundisediminis TaxID=2994553 RepID=A0A9X3I0W9_9FLAO|nr:aldo/keto reductase [Salinimicrobium profundisediminis]MCX2837964.1 aldo/keto reductase [Salinimicrobium profundisediminis]
MDIGNINGTTTLHNGVTMPVLGLGVYKAKEGSEVIESVHHALDAGYRHIDTASFYENESGVGEAIKSSKIPREEIFVTTKVWNDDQGFEETLKAFDKSLEKLGLDYIDLYLIHWPVPGKYVETWKALEKLYSEGKVKAIGVSNFLEHQLKDILNDCSIKPMVLQNEFHPRLVQQSLIDFCKRSQIQYEAWSPLMRGEVFKNPLLKELAKKYGKTVAQLVIRWDLQKGVVTIPKSVHRNRIFENADVFDFEISEENMRRIDALDREERTGAHPDDFMDHFRNS